MEERCQCALMDIESSSNSFLFRASACKENKKYDVVRETASKAQQEGWTAAFTKTLKNYQQIQL